MSDAKATLHRNRPLFEELAQAWFRESSLREIYRFSDDSFRCNGEFANIRTPETGPAGQMFDAIAASCGVSSNLLRSRLAELEKGKIYGIRLEAMGDARWVEILLEGSAWAPRGFRYVPPDRETLAYFRKLAAAGGFHRDVCFQEIGDGWFFFESDR